MADQKVNVIYTLKDKASKGLKSIFKSVFSLRNMMIGAAGLAGAIYKTTQLFETQRKVLAQTEQVLNSTGYAAGLTADEISKMAKELQRATNFGDEIVQSGQNMLLTFTKIGGDIFPKATETMLDMSVAMNQGVKESAIQLGKALNDPILGVTALRRVGVQLTKQQEQSIKTFVEMNDIAAAQKVILTELAVQVGGSARAVVSPFEQLKNAVGDLGEKIGEELNPSLVVLAEKIKNFVEGDTEILIESLGVVLTTVKGIASAFLFVGEAIGKIAFKIVEFGEMARTFFEEHLSQFTLFKDTEQTIRDKANEKELAKEEVHNLGKIKIESKRIKAMKKLRDVEEKENLLKLKREETAEKVSQEVIQGMLKAVQENKIKSVGDAIKMTGQLIKKAVLNEVMASTMAGVARAFRDWPFPASLGVAAIAAAKGAAVMGAVNAIPFADGGIVPGNNTRGDKIPARLNSGEMILNEDQQSNLFNIANGEIDSFKSPDVSESAAQQIIIMADDGSELTRALYTRQKAMQQTGELT